MNRLTRQPDPAGFTLIELLIYIAIVSFVSIILLTLAANLIEAQRKSLVGAEADHNARYALARIVEAVRHSSSITTGSSTFGSHPGKLTLVMDDPARSPTVFEVVSGRLRLTEGVNAPVYLTTSQVTVSNLIFFNRTASGANAKQNVRVKITVETSAASGRQEFAASISLDTAATIRP